MTSYYLGIDVSKGYADFVLIDSQKQISEKNFQLDDTFDGHQKLFQFLESFFEGHPDATVYAAVESTGGYENNWFHALNKFQEYFNLKVARLNPKGIYHNNQASLKRIITDKVSAKTIAEYLINYPEKVNYENSDYFYPVRRKWNLIRSFTKEKVKYLNQLESYLYDANPDILVYCKDGVPQWVLKLLQQFPSAWALANATVDQVALIPYISRQRATELIENAKLSVASANDILTENSIIILAEDILRIEKRIAEQVDLILEHYPLPELELLKSFKSIGNISSLGLLIEIGVVERFPSVKHLASFFGLHPAFKMSGDGTWGIHMSKEGRKEPRAILYMVTLTAINHNPYIKEIYIENLKKGKTKMDAIGVCMHKILRIIYGMLKNNKSFNPEIDRKNREKSKPSKTMRTQSKDRRFQGPDQNAPISRRQNKKRKEQEQSQDDNIVIHEIKNPALSYG